MGNLERRLSEPAFRPDLLLLNCGLHDVKTSPETGAMQVPETSYCANLMRIVDLLAANHVRAIWVRTTHCDDAIHNSIGAGFRRCIADIDTYNGIADEVMTAAGLTTIDLYGFTRDLGEDTALFTDHVHFQWPVCAQQAAFIAGVFMALSKTSK